MGDATSFCFSPKAMMPCRSSSLIAPVARRGEAHEFIEEGAVVRLASAFRHQLDQLA
jgi:hypothetical protein